MKPLRRVMSTAHVLAFRLECGHTIHRPPLTGKRVIPLRMGCDECQREALRQFDQAQAVTRAVEVVLSQARLTRAARRVKELTKND